MNVTSSQAKALLLLRSGKELPRSSISPTLRSLLLSKGACRLISSGQSRGKIAAVGAAFDRVLRDVLKIKDLPALANLSAERTRTEVAAASSHSKTFRASPLQGGWLLRAVGSAEICIGNTGHKDHPAGVSLFVQRPGTRKVEINCDHLIGVENVDTFLRAELLFERIPANVVFMLRWGWGQSWREWIAAFPGKVSYLGDYDPKGVAIFHDELLVTRPDARFLMPSGLPTILSRGDSERFNKQQSLLPRLAGISHSDINVLISAITLARKGLDQESLLNGSIGALS